MAANPDIVIFLQLIFSYIKEAYCYISIKLYYKKYKKYKK